MTPKLIAIAATTTEGIIAVNGNLPLHSTKDMAFFKKMTTGHYVIMGRKTFDSLPAPLPNRHNIVITRSKLKADPSVYYTDSYINAFRYVTIEDTADVFIIGGAQIYRDLIPMCDELYLTVFDTWIETDSLDKLTSFPYSFITIKEIFSKVSIVDEFIENGIKTTILHFTKT